MNQPFYPSEENPSPDTEKNRAFKSALENLPPKEKRTIKRTTKTLTDLVKEHSTLLEDAFDNKNYSYEELAIFFHKYLGRPISPHTLRKYMSEIRQKEKSKTSESPTTNPQKTYGSYQNQTKNDSKTTPTIHKLSPSQNLPKNLKTNPKEAFRRSRSVGESS